MFDYFGSAESDLLDRLERMRREMSTSFTAPHGTSGIRSVASGSYPAINVGAAPERVDVYAFLSGVDRDALSISIQRNLLTIAGERAVAAPDAAQFYRRERFTGPFHRVVTLPEDVDPEKVQARYRDGLLQVTIERLDAVRPRRVEIK